MDAISSACLNMHLEYDSLISKLLEWSSTNFRRGSTRIYVTVRLLRKWRKSGIDTDSSIVSFLQHKAESSVLEKGNIYHVISELVRSQSFAVGKYLQWLVARGAVTNDKPMHPNVELLVHLPSRRLPSHVWNLRNTLLTRAGFSINTERQQTLSIKSNIYCQLSDVITKPVPGDSVEVSPPINLSSLGWTIKSEIGQWIREHVMLHRKRYLRTVSNHGITGRAVEISALTPAQFFKIRDIIENLGDLSLLADILKQASSSDDITVLISVADTLNCHTEPFKAIGASTDLFKSILAGYSNANKADLSIIDLISSLLEVGIKLPHEQSAMIMLRRDLSRFDKSSSAAASSPASEHTVDSINLAKSGFIETLHQLLNSGTTLDEANINLLNSSSRPCLLAFLPPLVGVGCVTLHSFFAFVNGLLDSDVHRQSIPNITGLRLDMVNILCKEKFHEHDPFDFVSYRFKIAREDYITQHSYNALGLINETFAEITGCSTTDIYQVVEKWTPSILPLLCDIIVQNLNTFGPEGAGRIVEEFPNCVNAIHQALDILLGSRSQAGEQKTQSIVELIDDFSLSYCLTKLRLLLETESNGDTTRSSIVNLLFKTAESDVRAGERRWLEVLNVLPINAAQLIRQRAECELLGLPFLSTHSPDSSNEETALIFLRIVEELSYSIPNNFVPSSMGNDLGDKMQSLLQRTVELGNIKKDPDILTPELNSIVLSGESSIGVWFFILLRLVALHRSLLPTNQSSKAELNHQIRLLIRIICISRSWLFASRSSESFNSSFSHFTHDSHLLLSLPSSWPSLQLQALDVCSTLADTLPDEARNECARFLREKYSAFLHPDNDPRLLYLLGPFAEPQPVAANVGSGMPANTPVTSLLPHLQPISPQNPSIPTSAAALVEDPDSFTNNLHFQQNGRTIGPYPPKPWEMLGEAAPMVGVNDTPVNLTYFGTRQVKLP
ncbi:predicted protein [Uncinocarpus reesii 1704]|uniref:SRB8 ARM-like domain-containing protein n=1 Tax=Uncinocarpus reesii (strain UAMH 1704) TaxID=336963 RepID=C4JE34_UNCRE|nr:uncharacterized protein UREG_00458 [Uncinocarpus reesii 1704]EEP75612.1 predicted protein [Uncinocarpus reesii 1704]